MPMKISLALGERKPLSRQTAWGCMTSNLALPGLGSLVAGRPAGYVQLALAVVGLLLTTVFGIRFITWYVAHWSSFYGDQADPFAALEQMWIRVRWALLGIGIFGVGMLWAGVTSSDILRCAKSNEEEGLPPRLGPRKM